MSELQQYEAEVVAMPIEDEFATVDDVLAAHDAALNAEAVRGADSVRVYLNQIGKTALLDAEQEVLIAKRVEAGLYAGELLRNKEDGAPLPQRFADMAHVVRDLRWIARDGEKAKAHLIEANLRLVVSLAKRYTGRGMAFLDLIQEGNTGLIRAVEKFDYTKGFKFSTYGTWWIRQAITRALANDGTIRIPVHVMEDLNKLKRIRRDLMQQSHEDPTPEQLAEEMGMTSEEIMKLIEVERERAQLDSCDQPLGPDGDGTLGDFIADDDMPTQFDLVFAPIQRDALDTVLKTLRERDAEVMRLRYGLTDGFPRTLDEVALIYGLSRERIRQIEMKTLAKLRSPERLKYLGDQADIAYMPPSEEEKKPRGRKRQAL